MHLLKESRNTVSLLFKFVQEMHFCTTFAIRNAGESAVMKVILIKKIFGERTVKCNKNPHYA